MVMLAWGLGQQYNALEEEARKAAAKGESEEQFIKEQEAKGATNFLKGLSDASADFLDIFKKISDGVAKDAAEADQRQKAEQQRVQKLRDAAQKAIDENVSEDTFS